MLKRRLVETAEDSRGFTLVELLVAMTVFSFMLLIITVGFINIVHIHNQAVAANNAEDNGRTALDEVVRAIRNSSGMSSIANGPNVTLCLEKPDGGQQTVYYVPPHVSTSPGILTRGSSDTCDMPPAGDPSVQAITSDVVTVSDFTATSSSAGTAKPPVNLSLTVASNNGTAGVGSGASVQCGPTAADRTFCSTVTLKSSAVPR